jgi:N-acetylmuramoyl-L-alanine amidase
VKLMKKHAFLLGMLISAALAAFAAHAAVVSEIRVKNDSEPTRVLVKLSEVTSYKLFTLKNPDRVVLDLRDTQLGTMAKVPRADGIIDEIRTGKQPAGTLRLVLELKSATPAKAAWAEASGASGQHLVVTLGDQPALAATEEEDEPPPKAVRAAHAPEDSNRDVVVAIDAGHGGQDPGAIGRNGTREKDVVLAISRALAKRINAEPGMRAVLTRESDAFLTLRDRIKRARVAKADMFVSVHADSIRDRDVSGSSVYVLSERGATDEAARWLAERENAADLMGGVTLVDKDDTLASVLLDLSQSASISASMVAAERVLAALNRVGEVRKPQVQQAGFVVLKSPDIPSMLVETAYISNPSEEKRLRTNAHQAKLAEAIFKGVHGYFEQNPPPGTRFAQIRRAGSGAVLAAGPTAP